MFALFLNAFRLLKAIIRSWNSPKFRGGLLLAVLFLLSGTIFYHSVEGWTWVDAFYFSVVTVSTVGSADISPQTDIGKMFTAIYIFAGVGVFAALTIQFAKSLLRDLE